jgi:large-conductance mechanosensitive channel
MLVLLGYLLVGLAITFVITRAVGAIVRGIVHDNSAPIWTFAITAILLLAFAYFTVPLRGAIALFAPGLIVWLLYDLFKSKKNAHIR